LLKNIFSRKCYLFNQGEHPNEFFNKNFAARLGAGVYGFHGSQFSGPEAGVSVTMNGGATKYQETGQKESAYGGSSLGFRLHGGYGFDIAKDTVVLIGFDYNATDIAAGTASGNSLKIKNSWSLSAAPSMLLNDKTLAYVKLSYEAGKLVSSSDSDEESISGIGYGVGLRAEINKTTFLQTEIKQVKYDKSIQVVLISPPLPQWAA